MARIGIVGGRGMLGEYVPGIRKAGAEVSCLVCSTLQNAERAAGEWGIPGHCSFQDLLDKGSQMADGLIIATPNDLHAQMTISALEAGFHVLCEKPPALNAEEAKAMAEAAQAANRHLAFNFKMRGQAGPQWLKARICEVNQQVKMVDARWLRRNGIPGQGGWFTNQGHSGGGALMDLGSHVVDLGMWLLGYPKPVSALAGWDKSKTSDPQYAGPWPVSASQPKYSIDVENACWGCIGFANGSIMNFAVSWASLLVRQEIIQVSFDGDTLGGRVERTFEPADGRDMYARDLAEVHTQEAGQAVNSALRVKAPNPIDGVEKVIGNFVDLVAGRNVEPLTTPGQAVTLMKVIDAVKFSASNRASVGID